MNLMIETLEVCHVTIKKARKMTYTTNLGFVYYDM